MRRPRDGDSYCWIGTTVPTDIVIFVAEFVVGDKNSLVVFVLALSEQLDVLDDSSKSHIATLNA